MAFAATPSNDGTLSRFFRVPGSLVYPLPDHISLEEGSAMEPLAVAVHAVSSLGNFTANQSIAVFGCGPVGLLCMAVAKALGAARIIAIDVQESRLEFAKTYFKGGVQLDTYVPVAKQDSETTVEYSMRNGANMKKVLGIEDQGPKSVDLVVDASGAETCIQTSFYVAKTRGCVVQLGIGAFFVTLDLSMVLLKELVFRGSFRYGPGDYALAIALTSQGKVDVKPLITHRYPFTSALEAFKAVQSGEKGLVKAVISGPGVDVDDNWSDEDGELIRLLSQCSRVSA
ncbi:hypothetical protein PM082_000647 [Marasmius tenuissimus]|nr:hypothetical protein PM082_000647 [Marasmius tenuissimus]